MGEWFQEWKAKPSSDPRFGSSGDEELHGGQLLDKTAQNGQDRGGGLIIHTLVQSVHDDDARKDYGGEGIYNQVFELRYERISCYGGVSFYGVNDFASKCRVAACELIGKCGEDVLEFLAVEVIPETEEARPERPVVRKHFGERLCDSRFSRSRQSVEPKDVSFLRILGPLHDIIEDRLPSPPQTYVVMTGLIPRTGHRI